MSDENGQIADTDTELTDDSANRQVVERALRLKQAVKAAGGQTAVAHRSGVPVGTINHYLSGKEMKAASMIALARACNVSLDWLATGIGPLVAYDPTFGKDQQPQRGQIHMHVYAAGAKLFETLDMDRFGAAIDAATERFAASNAVPKGRELGMVIALFYDGFSSGALEQAPSTSSKPVTES